VGFAYTIVYSDSVLFNSVSWVSSYVLTRFFEFC
jgi:hypothetical protein